MKFICLLLSFLVIPFITTSIAQGTHSNTSGDLTHSVFGPPISPIWEFQLGYLKEDGQNISSFNFYKKDQRNKTLFFKIANNNLNNRNEFRVKEITGGAVLFPINDDDRLQLDLGGTYDVAKDTSLPGKALYSRITYRPQQNIWFRFGSEYFDGYTLGHSYRNTILNSNYLVGRYSLSPVSVVGLIGNGKIDNALNTRFGFAGIVEGPFNIFALAGYIKSDDEKENVRTLAVGRWAPFRPDGLPSAVFIWKHKSNYDFQLGGVFWGKQNLFVRPAAIGMTQGMFISSTALRENSELRQGQLMTITDDYRNSDITLFYVYLDQAIEMIPGSFNHVGFKAVQLFKIFDELKFSVFSKPVIGLFYNEETEPSFNPRTRKFIDVESSFWSFQAGLTLNDSFILNVIHTPHKSEWNVALSFLLLNSGIGRQ
jgi:hypothetical protein